MNKQVHVVNVIDVPDGCDDDARDVRDRYVAYFKAQPGFVSSTFLRELDVDKESTGSRRYINTVVWASQADYDRVVAQARDDRQRENADGMKVLGDGFQPPISISPGRYAVVSAD